ncbi:transposable element Tcb1 transposase [Trichonephila clavipes]|nr:transposable element Tcb1 transposase [Trichonephila clavipes]
MVKRRGRHLEWHIALLTNTPHQREDLITNSCRTFIWREPGTLYLFSNVHKIDSYGGRGLMVWAGIMLDSMSLKEALCDCSDLCTEPELGFLKYTHFQKLSTGRKIPIRIEEDAICCRGRWKYANMLGESIMVWAGISLGYRNDLHIFKRGSVTAVRYRGEVLEPIVRLYAVAVGNTFVLMDDKAHPHRAEIVDDYLESERIARMAWPAYLFDLNPIENLWDALGRAVSSRFPPPATLIELKTALQEEWRLLSSAVVDHLIESMFHRKLQRKGMFSRMPGKKPLISARNAKVCFQWCRKRRLWTSDD